MANRYWVGGTDSWNSTAGSKWASTSGGTGGQSVPSSSDDVFFDANSGSNTITITTTANAQNITFTGFTGTLSQGANIFLYGNLTLVSAMTYTNSAGNLFGLATSGIQTITSNSKTIPCSFDIQATGATIFLADSISLTGNILLKNGTFDANNQNVTCQTFQSSNANTRVITMGSGTWTLTGTGTSTVWDCATTTNLTVNANTSTIKITGTGTKTFAGGGKTYYNFWDNRTTQITKITGANTFNNFKADSGQDIQFTASTTTTVASFTFNGTPGGGSTLESTTSATHTISCPSGTISISGVDVRYSIATGGATFNDYGGTNGGNNTNWNFLTGSNRYWVGGTGNWDTTNTHWAYASGLGGGAPYPTATENVYFDGSSGGGVATVTGADAHCLLLDTTGFTGTLQYSGGGYPVIINGGSLTIGSGTTVAGANGKFRMTLDSSTQTITSNGVSIAWDLQIGDGTNNGLVSLADDLTMGNFTLTKGTFSANNKNISCGQVDISNTNTRTLTMGSGTWTITGTSSNVWSISDTTNLTFNCNTSTIKFTGGGSSTRGMYPGALTYYNVWVSGTLSGNFEFSGANNTTFNDIKDTGTVAHNLVFVNGQIYTVSSFTVNGTAGNLISLRSNVAGNTWTLSKSSGVVNCNYLDIKDSIASGGATFNDYAGTNSGNNTGWNFYTSQSSGNFLAFM